MQYMLVMKVDVIKVTYATSLDIRKPKDYISPISGSQLSVDKYQSTFDRLIIIIQVDPIIYTHSLCKVLQIQSSGL